MSIECEHAWSTQAERDERNGIQMYLMRRLCMTCGKVEVQWKCDYKEEVDVWREPVIGKEWDSLLREDWWKRQLLNVREKYGKLGAISSATKFSLMANRH